MQRKEGHVVLKKVFQKHSFERSMARMVCKLIGYQLLAMLIYVVMTLLVMMIFADKEGYINPWNEVFATIFTEAVVLIIAYKPLWNLGEEHAGSLQMRYTRGTKYSGLQMGLLAVSPIIVAWFFDMLLGFFSLNASIFNSILGYMLYPWEPYFNVCKLYLDATAWYMPFFYIPAIIPLPILCHVAYTNGIKGWTVHKALRNLESKRAAKASAKKS